MSKILPHGARKTKEAVNEHGLTALQEQFCHAYLIRFNVAHAEKIAGIKKGIGSKWMQELKVRERITKIRVETGKAFDITRERMLQELMNIIYCDPRLMKGDDIVKWPDEEVSALAELDVATVKGIKYIKTKRFDKLKAIEIVNKMLGYNMPDVSKVLPGNAEPLDKKEVIEIAKILRDEL